MSKSRNPFLAVYKVLLAQHGYCGWWPAETPFEIMVGAILTQNTAWSNVKKAIVNLQQADALNAERILSLADNDLAELIRPSGYFNLKMRRLKNYCDWYQQAGGEDSLGRLSTQKLRDELLAVNGIGPETADDILLYAFERPVFVIDAYTRRIFSRLGLVDVDLDYEQMRAKFERELDSREIIKQFADQITDTKLFSEYHALIDTHAAQICKKKPVCDRCSLANVCEYIVNE